MAKFAAPGYLVIKDENMDLHPNKGFLNAKSKNSKTDGKKGGKGNAGRKALNDITNKTSLFRPEASTKKKNLPKQEDINVKEEMFLHDHSKCIAAQQAEMNNFNIDLVLPQDDSFTILEQIKIPDSPICFPEPKEVPELQWSPPKLGAKWSSPPSSPLPWEVSVPSPLPWEYEEFKLALKEEVDAPKTPLK